MYWILTFAVGLITGIIASFFVTMLWTQYIFRQKPKISMSDKIYYYVPGIHENWRTYWIMIANEGKEDIIDIGFHLMFKKRLGEGEFVTTTYPLLRSSLFYLASPKRTIRDSRWRLTFKMAGQDGDNFKQYLTATFPNVQRIQEFCKEDDPSLDRLLDYFDFIKFLVRGTYARTGVTAVEKIIYKREDIVEGRPSRHVRGVTN